MVAVLGQNTGAFLYDTIENARQCKKEGLLGWLFWTQQVFEILEHSKVETCLIERVENSKDFIESDLQKVRNAFKTVKEDVE